MKWTVEQEQLLVEYSMKGVSYARDAISRTFGVVRTVEATRRHANRLGISMSEHPECPECGRVARLNRNTGLCNSCNLQKLIDNQRAINRDLIRMSEEMDRGESNDYKEKVREYDRLRQNNRRLRRKSKATQPPE